MAVFSTSNIDFTLCAHMYEHAHMHTHTHMQTHT